MIVSPQLLHVLEKLHAHDVECRCAGGALYWAQTIELHVDFDLTHGGSMEASRLHAAVKSEPVCGDHTPHSTALDRREICELFRAKRLREIPHWASANSL